jgi:MFS family permease
MIESKKFVAGIAIITAICLLGNAMLYVVLPIYWRDFGLSSLWEAGILLSINRLLRLPLNPLVNWFYNRFDKKTGVIVAIILAFISTLSYGFLKGFIWLLIMRCVWGAAWTLLRIGGLLTVVELSSDKNRGELMGTYNSLWGLGHLGGALLGGLLTELVGLKFVTITFGIIALLCIPLAYHIIPHGISRPIKKEIPTKLIDLLFEKKNRPLFLSGFLIHMIYFGIIAFTLSRIVEFHIPHNISVLGLLIGAASISGIIQALKSGWEPFVSPKVGKLTDTKGIRSPLLAMALISTAFTLVLISIPSTIFLAILILLVMQFMSTIATTLCDTLAADKTAKENQNKTEIMTGYTIVTDLGVAIGPLLASLFEQSLTPLYVGTAVLLIGLGISVLKSTSTEASNSSR